MGENLDMVPLYSSVLPGTKDVCLPRGIAELLE
jgi:hypothetical protein